MPTLLTHARIINGKGREIEDGWVLVEGDTITAVDGMQTAPPGLPATKVDLN